jgi:hypothetical protein
MQEFRRFSKRDWNGISSLPVIIEEDNSLYKIFPGGEKKFIGKIPRNKKILPKNFRLG